MAFFANAINIDVRNSHFTQIGGSQFIYFGDPSLGARPSRSQPSRRQQRYDYLPPAPGTIAANGEQMTTDESDLQQQLTKGSAAPPTKFKTASIHTEQLPVIGTFLDHGLTDFRTNFSPWKQAMQWIQDDKEHLRSIIRAITQLTESNKIMQIDFIHKMIFPRLVLYLFAHLMLCTNNKASFTEFKRTLKTWKTWNGLTMIQNHQEMRDYLRGLFQGSFQPHSDIHPEYIFNKLLTLDIICLSAYLAVTVTDDVKYKALMQQRGPEAQSLINLLQARLDFPVDSAYKPRHVKALVQLSRASHQYPECLDLDDIDIDEHPEASGSFGDIYKGRLNGQVIAVKVLKVYRNQDLVKFHKDFSSEAVVWRQLSHPNVLPFYGVFCSKDNASRVCLVAPWLENGNVVEFLKRNPNTQCVQLALDITLGLEYLHNSTPAIIHGDLKGVNILITRSRRACLADFGFAVLNSQTLLMTHASTAKSSGTVRWQAPELFDSDSASESFPENSSATDIYSFACVCYEMFSGQIPFHNIKRDMKVLNSVTEGMRPVRPSDDISRIRGLTDDVWNLMQTCWAQNAHERPNATLIVEQLRSLRPVDTRLFDDTHSSALSQAMYAPNHPFFALGPNNHDDAKVQALKWMSQ